MKRNTVCNEMLPSLFGNKLITNVLNNDMCYLFLDRESQILRIFAERSESIDMGKMSYLCFVNSLFAMKRLVFTISLLLAGVLVSCQKDVLKPVDDVCSVMDDDVFKEYCLKSFDSDGDGVLSMEEAAQVKIVNVSERRRLTSLKGIEYFSNLEELFCRDIQLTALNVTRNINLTSLFCGSNKLPSLDVTKCSKLI